VPRRMATGNTREHQGTSGNTTRAHVDREERV
jgi:hypothetical protein